MRFKTKCIYCGRYHHSPNYSCSCNNATWFHRYRTSDIEIDLVNEKSAIAFAYNNYQLNNPPGMLQYRLLPHRRFAPASTRTVGLTPLHKLANFKCMNGCKIYLKDEGRNPSGCFKDRESLMCWLHSRYLNLDKAVIYSSGNAAASAANFAKHSKIQLITVVPGDTYPEKINFIRNHGSNVIVIGGKETNFEKGYRLFSDMNAKDIFPSHSFDNWSVRNPYRVQGDKTIALEIVKQLSEENTATNVPDYVIVPTANGSCLTGIWKGFKELYRGEVIDKLPKMIAGGIKNASPVYKAVKQKETKRPLRCDLSDVDKKDAEVGSIILAEEGYDSIEAAKAVIESDGLAVELHASDIQQALIHFLEQEQKRALKHAILPEPAALTSLAALGKLDERITPSDSEIFVSIATGHGLKARKKISELLANEPQLQKVVEQIVEKRKQNVSAVAVKKGKQLSVKPNITAISETFAQLEENLDHERVVSSV